jgi:hypothetical protein
VDVPDAPTAEDLRDAEADACADLLEDLPATLDGQDRRDVTPDGALAAAWGDPAIVVRCGVDEPAEFDRVAECVTVDDVDWFFPGDDLVAPEGPDVVFSVVNRAVTVEVTRAADYGPPAEVLADLSGPVSEHVPATGSCR